MTKICSSTRAKHFFLRERAFGVEVIYIYIYWYIYSINRYFYFSGGEDVYGIMSFVRSLSVDAPFRQRRRVLTVATVNIIV